MVSIHFPGDAGGRTGHDLKDLAGAVIVAKLMGWSMVRPLPPSLDAKTAWSCGLCHPALGSLVGMLSTRIRFLLSIHFARYLSHPFMLAGLSQGQPVNYDQDVRQVIVPSKLADVDNNSYLSFFDRDAKCEDSWPRVHLNVSFYQGFRQLSQLAVRSSGHKHQMRRRTQSTLFHFHFQRCKSEGGGGAKIGGRR